MLRFGGLVSEATGQHTLALTLTNTAGVTCHLQGYPGIALVDAQGGVLPLVYRRGGDQMVTSKPPSVVNLPSGAVGYVWVNQYRCDLGVKDEAVTVRVIPPGETGTLSLSWGQYPIMAFCGTSDPGSTLDISPLEATAAATSAVS